MGFLVFGLRMAPAVAGEEVKRLSLEAVQLAPDRNPEMALNQEAIEKASGAAGGRGRRSGQRPRHCPDFSAANMELLSAAILGCFLLLISCQDRRK